MALARCESCGSPKGLKQNYTHFHNLASSENRTIVCGSRSCAHHGCMWLTDEEQRQYLYGQRVFHTSNRSRLVQVA
jgi:hypothetical protein